VWDSPSQEKGLIALFACCRAGGDFAMRTATLLSTAWAARRPGALEPGARPHRGGGGGCARVLAVYKTPPHKKRRPTALFVVVGFALGLAWAQGEFHSAAQARAWADGDFDADHGFAFDGVGHPAHCSRARGLVGAEAAAVRVPLLCGPSTQKKEDPLPCLPGSVSLGGGALGCSLAFC
jgi:hypothetical protein